MINCQNNKTSIVVVCGLGRCGSSLVMQMLDTGGLECTGEYPMYEDDNGSVLNTNPEWLSKQSGKATKILIPHEYDFMPANYKFIWIDRDPFEQAKSQMKFTHYVLNPLLTDKFEISGENIIKFMNSYKNERDESVDYISKLGDVLFLIFEDIIIHPTLVSIDIAEYLQRSLDITKMANQVEFRTTKCESNMNLEAKLILEHESRK